MTGGPRWDKEREARIVAAHVEEHLLLTEIAWEEGVTVERVRQILRRAGVTPEQTRAVQKARTDAMQETRPCAECADPVTRGPYHHTRERWFCSRECAAAYRGRERSIPADDLRTRLQNLAARLGRTPSQRDVNGDPDTPCHMTYVKVWGSFRAAQEAAGLRPRGRGEHGHTDRLGDVA